MLHLVDKDHQYQYIPWLATYLTKNGTVTACPPVDRGEGVNINRHAFRQDRGFPPHFSPKGEELLSSCFAAMIHCLGARRCYVMLLDKGRSELVVVKTSSKGAPAPGDRIALSQSIAGWVVEHKQPLISANHKKGLGAAMWNGEYANGPFLAVPISGEEEFHGVLMACNKLNGGTFSEHDLVTAEMLANHLALCIEGGFLFQKDTEKLFSTTLPSSMGKPL